jgi:hypothetical protein
MRKDTLNGEAMQTNHKKENVMRNATMRLEAEVSALNNQCFGVDPRQSGYVNIPLRWIMHPEVSKKDILLMIIVASETIHQIWNKKETTTKYCEITNKDLAKRLGESVRVVQMRIAKLVQLELLGCHLNLAGNERVLHVIMDLIEQENQLAADNFNEMIS